MGEVRYMISEAAKKVNVETHVLRYWEEELDLKIPRNEMGHRYYTRDNIKEFQKIKDLKDQVGDNFEDVVFDPNCESYIEDIKCDFDFIARFNRHSRRWHCNTTISS